jgi:WD40 repeat protein/energy-coupling factor transporter ATP-binding protein EcfA2
MTEKYNVFLSHNSQDKPMVEQIAQWLEDNAKLSVWLDKWNLIPGEPWQEEIEKALDESECCVVFFGADGMGPWQNEEMRLALDERVSQKTIRVVPVLLPGAVRPGQESKLPRFLRRLTWVRFGTGGLDPGALHRLVCGIKGITPGRHGGEIKTDICPFRGLEVFREQDHEYFFGRGAVVQRLMDKLETGRFLAVLGPSGCGKSSVVQAGLIPHLRERALVTLFTPRERPLEELAFALRKCYPEAKRPPAAQLLNHLKEPGESLHYFSREALEDTGKKNLVVVIDQFEEVFTQAGSEEERKNFILAVLNAVEVSNGPVMVILTMRSDFIGKCAFYPDLNTYVNDYFFQVDSMNREELRRAIEEPARLVDIHFEEGLVNRILNDVKGAPCELPLLGHALLELYERRQGNRLTARAYEKIGGIEGALVKRAEAEFKKLDNTQKNILRRMFVLRLIQPGEGTEDTRRRAAKDELMAVGEDSRVAEGLLTQWVNARLLTINRDSSREQDLVDVAHEALIRKWDKIQVWMAEGREEARLIGILRQAALEWESAHRNPDYLFQGARLIQVEELLKTHAGDLTGLEKEFVNAGIGLREWQIKEGEKKREKELQAARELAAARAKAVKRSRAVIVVVLFSLILSIYFGVTTSKKEKTIRKQIAMNYWVDSEHARGKGNNLDAMYLCAKALGLNPGGELQQALLLDMNSYWNLFPLLNIFQHEKAVRGGAFNHDGTRILTWSEDGIARLWDAGTGREIRRFTHEGLVLGAAFNRAGPQVLTWSSDSIVRRWHADTGQQIKPDLKHEKGSLCGAAFNQKGTRILTCGEDKTARLWDSKTGKEIRHFTHEGTVLGAAFYRDGPQIQILTWSDDSTARLWDGRTGKEIRRFTHEGLVLGAAFNQDKPQILTWSSDKTARKWDVDRGKQINRLEYDEALKGTGFSHNWTRVLTWSDDNVVRIWDVGERSQIEPALQHKGAVRGAAFNGDGTRILTWSSDKTARLWDADANIGKQIGLDLMHKEDVWGAVFNRSETRILSWSDDKTARLWGAHAGEKVGPEPGSILSASFNQDGTRTPSGNRWIPVLIGIFPTKK